MVVINYSYHGDQTAQLKNNKVIALQRLETIQRKRNRDSEFKIEYGVTIRSYYDNGFTEKLDPTTTREKMVYYMLHRALVKRDRTTTKVRVVFDASSHAPFALP
ncbi:hypothetical protein HPB48_018922 [Haemaphysalis longicornis]|uniref:Uncharacterized protein n=1 Tax=Haemaphysalis longicornis TaxID=44386 RepID=A0A9J6GH74_HAELO|nr:hypothetical protein HPB48_018922 [Haemaphysalis longicornis]